MIAKLKAIWASLLALWASLPHQVQALILAFLTAVGTTLIKELEQLVTGNEAFTRAVLRHDIAFALGTGIAAVKLFYMLPNGAAQLVASAKAGLNPAPQQNSNGPTPKV